MNPAEALSSVLGKCGPFQRKLLLLMSLPVIMKGYQTMMVILIFDVPAHRCSVPGLLNDSYVIQDESHGTLIEEAIPWSRENDKFAQCDMYESWNRTAENVTRQRNTVKCESWVYDESELKSTLVTKFNLVCDKKAYRAHFNLASMIGKLIGSFLTGVLCDRFGRKPILLISVIGCAVIGTISAFPPSSAVFFVYRLVLVICGTAVYYSFYVLGTYFQLSVWYVIEFMCPSKRSLAGSLMNMTWVLGPLLSGATAYATGVWWHIQLISSVPFLLCIGYWWLVPESPRWLVSRGRTDEAMAVLRKVASANGINIQQASHTADDEHEENIEEKGFLHAYRLLRKHPRLIVRMLIIFFNWQVLLECTYA
ncbi:hypothetical protein BaRGS_00005567 [Batillaria attramentaria]|uniref:Major facilitator superfamily (MFS) profile domain-containing protein n=1 Tax=Batillaria attramentaria TaxID=370345 RepID=A0ABD0LVB9_9CAEN